MIKNLRKFIHLKYDIFIVPRVTSSTKNSIKLRVTTVIFIFFAVLLVSNVIFYLLIMFSPLGRILPINSYITPEDYKQLSSLKEKVIILSNEVERVQRINERLKLILEGKPIPIDPRDLDTNYQIKKRREDSLRLLQKSKFTNNLAHFINLLNKKIKNIHQTNLIDSAKNEKSILFFIKPVDGIVTRGFNRQLSHFGIDFAVPVGTIVRASASGIAIFADYTINDGYKIIISHDKNYVTVYKHLSQILVRERDIVKQGDIIGLSGNTGRLTIGPHLHFEIWKYQTPLDPKQILVDYYER